MADISHIGPIPDRAYIADGSGESHVKSLQSMTETSVRQAIRAPVDGAFGGTKESFGGILGLIGEILRGTANLGGVAVQGVLNLAQGVLDFFRSIGSTVVSLLTGVDPGVPLPEIWSPIKADLEGELRPWIDQANQAIVDASAAQESIGELREDMEATSTAISSISSDVEAQGRGIQDLVGELGEKTGPGSDLAQGIDGLQQLVSPTGAVGQKITDAEQAARDAAGLAGTKGKVIYQASAPSGTDASGTNLWIRTADNRPHTWDGATWVAVTDKVATDAASLASILEVTLSDFVAQTTGDLAEIQSQVDGAIVTWYLPGVPTLSTDPAKNWTTEEHRTEHIGDLYYNKTTGKSYRFFKDGTSWVWVLITDEGISQAIQDASNAKDIADSKRRVFVNQPTPPYDAGDLWTQGTNGDLMRCKTERASGTYVSGDWEKASKYTDDAKANAAAQAAADANVEAKSKTTTYYQPATPIAKAAGDLWIDTDDKNKLHRWSGTAWMEVQDKTIQDALTKAGDAQATADGKVRTFAQTSAPSGMTTTDIGDLWIDTDAGNKLHRWSGTAWVVIQDEALAGLANDITELSQELSNAATQDDYNNLNARLWGEQGELNKLNTTLWNDQTGWNARMQDLTDNLSLQQTLAEQQDDLRDIVNDNQGLAIAANTRSIEAIQQYITRVMFLPDSATASTAENEHWKMTFSSTKRVITAKPGWVGNFIYHSAMHRSNDFGPVIEGGDITPTSRIFSLDVATSSASLMYTIAPGTPQLVTDTMASRNASANLRLDLWKSHMVTDAVPHTLRFKLGWDSISRNQRIVTLIRVNGVTQAINDQSGIGPVFPWENGYREQDATVTLDLNVGDQVDFCTMTDGDTVTRRTIRSLTWWVEWVEPPANN